MLTSEQVVALRRLPNGCVIWFRHPSVTGRGGTRMFDYAAYQGSNGEWWTTATEENSTVPQHLTEEELIALLDDNFEQTQILQCVDWHKLDAGTLGLTVQP